jgi:hypothetical protein
MTYTLVRCLGVLIFDSERVEGLRTLEEELLVLMRKDHHTAGEESSKLTPERPRV